MKNKIFLFPLALAVIFFASMIIIFSPVGKKNIFKVTQAPIEWKTYTNDQYGFNFQIPADWEIEETETGVFNLGKKGEQYYFEGSPEKSAIRIIFETPYENSFDQLFEKYKTNMPNGITIEKTKLGRIEAGYIEFGVKEIFTIYNNYEIHTNIIGFSDNNSSTNVLDIYDQILSTFKFLPDTTDWQTYTNDQYGFEFQYPLNLHILKKNSQNEYYITSLTSSDIKYTKSPLDTDIVSMGTEYKIFFDNKKCNVWSDNFGIYGYGIFKKNTVDSFPANVSYEGPSDNIYRLNVDTDLGCVSLIGEYGQNTIDKSKIEFDQILSTFKFTK